MSKRCSILFFALFLAFAGLATHSVCAEGEVIGVVNRAKSCGVHSEVIDRIGGSTLEGTLTNAQGEQLLSVLVSACDANLPLSSFEDKLMEGLGKRVAPALIVRALNKKLADYLFVQELLKKADGEIDQQLLVILAEGISKGVSRQVAEQYVTSYGAQKSEAFRVGAEMTVLLHQVGFDDVLIRSMLDAGFAADSLSSQWQYFIRVVLVARQRGMDDRAVAEAAVDVLKNGGTPGDVSTRLGFTGRNLTGSQ